MEPRPSYVPVGWPEIPNTPAQQSATLTVDEVARILGVGVHVIYRGVKRGTLPTVRVGRAIRISKFVVERMLKEGS